MFTGPMLQFKFMRQTVSCRHSLKTLCSGQVGWRSIFVTMNWMMEVVGDEAQDHSHQHHQREQAGPAVVAPPACQGVVPGHPAQLDSDLHVAEEDIRHRPQKLRAEVTRTMSWQRTPVDAAALCRSACQPGAWSW